MDATSVHYTDDWTQTVMKVPLGGGTPVTLAARLHAALAITVDAESVYWVEWSTRADTKILKVSFNGGMPSGPASTVMAGDDGRGSSMTMDGVHATA